MNKIILIIILSLSYISNAQEKIQYEKLIQTINNQKEVDSLQLLHPNISIVKFSHSSSDKNLNKNIVSMNVGQIIMNKDSSYLKLLSKETIKEYKVKYIFLDANRLKKNEFKKTQKKILAELKEGISFSEIANKYSMDPRKNNGDLGWFPEGRMVENFETAIKNHKKDEIFQASDPERNWFFTIKKTHNEREIGEYEYIEVSKLKVNFINDSKNEKIFRPTILYSSKNNKITKIQIKKIECFNCDESIIDDIFIKDNINKCFVKMTRLAKEGKLKRNIFYVVPFNIKIE